MSHRIHPPIAYNISRLASRIFSRTPNGIDRVDMAYAQRFLGEEGDQDCGLLYLGPFGTRVVSKEKAARAISGIEAHFGEAAAAADPGVLRAVAAWTVGLAEKPRISPKARRRHPGAPTVAGYTLATIAAAGRRAAAALPARARYLCVSQFPLSETGAYDWLASRPDVKACFFIHDLLPLQYPEYFRRPELARHQRRLAQLARVGAGALVSTQQVAIALRAEMARLGRVDFPIHIAPMPMAAGFTPGPTAPELQGAAPYFIQCGTIEPRKNHLTILHAWRDMAMSLGAQTPKLILVGARGWENENVLDLLDRSPAIAEHVLELRGINTPTLVALMRGARALLMPSFAEGYGLPIMEALAVGTPVIASDIPVFQDIAAGRVLNLHPLNGLAWRNAIAASAVEPGLQPSAGAPPAVVGPLAFSGVDDFLASL
jgi:glycosyltransferase involved in cell wall biosynthesis